MPALPQTAALDSSLAFISDPYRFIAHECHRLGTDAFETRLMFEKAICMTGPEAARLLYDTERFERRGAMPGLVVRTLLGKGGVQGLDDAEHLHRKTMLMSLMTPDRIESLADQTAAEWTAAAERWAGRDEVVLFDEACEVLARAVCAWAGVPLPEDDVDKRTRQLTLLFNGAGSIGWRHVASRIARKRANAWAEGLVEDVRAGRLQPAENTAAHVISWHRTLDGQLLDAHIAGVDLLNILRPVVAIAVYVAFIGHALHAHPAVRDAIAGGAGDAAAERFVQEIRRVYPFFPAVAARVRHDFTWEGYTFPKGRRVILDLYGTDQDPRTWDDPEDFRPERFKSWDESPFNFIPQGGGDHFENHRCAGEWITIRLMKETSRFLAGLPYRVPEQDLQVDFSRLPALPKSGMVLRDVGRPAPAAQA
ncbi:cytochrome P450 [Rubrivirga sp. S365]|uniref:cytochrome P450 n=1 Tax=Rubrivirga sp. S365 TaxID=3076080 RepID=UPI0028C920F0|nr:cytochrome P450 [Rubrivirga sp. S365]MDT7856248.1 cytochrome P450 [Rubrivirga sp. S365]